LKNYISGETRETERPRRSKVWKKKKKKRKKKKRKIKNKNKKGRLKIRRCVLDTTLCDKVCQWLAEGRWISPGTPISFTNTNDRHDITEILLKVALNTIKP
jgi:hypothetical protein